jgi:tetratricopeptide (TPR) repeat protein
VETSHSQDRLDALLREANIHRLRGQTLEAEERCRAALELQPEEATALEMLGDLLRERGRLDEAAEQYQSAIAAAPERLSAERKFAELTLELAERQRLRDQAAFLLSNPPSTVQQRRNVTLALLLSAIFPGLGQFYNQQWLKGCILAVAVLICLGLGGDALLRLVFTIASARPAGAVSQWGAWFGFLGFVFWLYAVIDAVVTAQKRSAGTAR